MYKQIGNCDYNYFDIYAYRQLDGNDRANIIKKFYGYNNINIGEVKVIEI